MATADDYDEQQKALKASQGASAPPSAAPSASPGQAAALQKSMQPMTAPAAQFNGSQAGFNQKFNMANTFNAPQQPMQNAIGSSLMAAKNAAPSSGGGIASALRNSGANRDTQPGASYPTDPAPTPGAPVQTVGAQSAPTANPNAPPPPPSSNGATDPSAWNEKASGGLDNIDGVGFLSMGEQKYNQYNLNQGAYVDHSLDKNHGIIDAEVAGLKGEQTKQMSGAAGQAFTAQGSQATAATTDPSLNANLAEQARGGGAVGQATTSAINKATDSAISSQMALAASQQGGNPMLAYRNAMNNAATSQQQAAGQIGAQTAQNALTATGQQIQNSQFNTGNEQAVALNNSQQAQQNSQFNAGQQQTNSASNAQLAENTQQQNMQSAVQQRQFIDQQVALLQSQGFSLDQAQFQAQQNYAKQQQDSLAAQQASQAGHAITGAGQQVSTMGTIASTVGTVAAAASDKRAKKNISDGEDETRRFLEALHPHGFEYKDPQAFGDGHHIGVMAQDVEKAAPDIVIDDTDGVKKLDMRKALSASLASLGSINKRLGKIEARRG